MRDPAARDALAWWESMRLQPQPERQRTPPRQRTTAMDQPSQDAWNAWATALIKKHAKQREEIQKQTMAIVISEIRRELRDEQKAAVAKLEEEVGLLRAELSVMRGTSERAVVPLRVR